MNGIFALGAVALLVGAAPAVPTVGEPPAASRDYQLGPSDKVRVIVFGEEALSGEFSVTADGVLAFPLIGSIRAAGQTPTAVQIEIATRLKEGYLHDPRVSVEVLKFRPFYILGEVQKPGEYPYSSGLTVLKAVATAGGFSYRANTKYVYMRSPGEDKEHREALTPTTAISAGDTVRIGERFF